MWTTTAKAGKKKQQTQVQHQTQSITSQYECEACQRQFDTKRGCSQHKRRTHGIDSSDTSSISSKKSKDDTISVSSRSVVCPKCGKICKNVQGFRLHQLKCKGPETEATSISVLSAVAKDQNAGQQSHLNTFLASMSLADDQPSTSSGVTAASPGDPFKKPVGRPSQKKSAGPINPEPMDTDTGSELFQTCTERSSSEDSSSCPPGQKGRRKRRGRKRQIGQRRKGTRSAASSTSSASMQSIATREQSPGDDDDDSPAAEEQQPQRRSSRIAASAPGQSRQACGTERWRLPNDFEAEVKRLKKKYNWKDPRTLTSDCPNYKSLLEFATEFEKTQDSLINYAIPPELVAIVKDKDQINKPDRPHACSKEQFKRLDRIRNNHEVEPPAWPWAAAEQSQMGKFNDEIFELWRDTHCQFRTLHCPECGSGSLQLGEELEASRCSLCLDRLKGRETARKDRLAEHLEQMKPQDGGCDLPELEDGEKAIIAPVHPVVTITRNTMRKMRFRQECINLLRHPDELWSVILPRVSLKKRFVVIERRVKAQRRAIKIQVKKVKDWLEYLFEHHPGFIKMKEEGSLKLSQEAIEKLKRGTEDLEDCTSESPSEDSDDAGSRRGSSNTSRPSDPISHAEADAGLERNEVFCLDQEPSLYLKKRDFLRIEKDGKLAIIPDTDRRTPIYDPDVSSNMAFPHLYPNGEKAPTDIHEYSLARILLKYQTQFAKELENERLRWKFAEESIHLMHEYARLIEMEAHARSAGYFIENGPGASSVPVEQLLDAFEIGPDGFGKFDTNIPELHRLLVAMKNTREFWYSKRLEIETISRDLGDANYFLTLNMEPRAWPDVRRLLYALEFGRKKVMPKNWFVRNNNKFTKLMDKYAVQLAVYLQHKACSFMKTYLSVICGIPEDETKSKDWRKSEGGRLNNGWFWGRPEFTETRGIQHWHILAKLPNVIDTSIIAKLIHLGRITRDELKAGNIRPECEEIAFKYIQIGRFADRYACKFAESISCASFYDKNMGIDEHDPNAVIELDPLTKAHVEAWADLDDEDAVNCRTHPIMREFDDSDIEEFVDDPIKTRNVENAKVAATTGLHACLPDKCGGIKSQKGEGCRFGFPKKPIPHTVCCIYPINSQQVELQVLVRRTEGRCPNLNRHLLRYWRGNHDSTALFDAGHKLRYATKYVSKGPKHGELIQNMVDELRKRCDGIMRISRQQIVSHMILASASHRAFLSKQELAYKVMDLPLTYKTFNDVKVEGYYHRFFIREMRKKRKPAKPVVASTTAHSSSDSDSPAPHASNSSSSDDEEREEILLADQTSYSAYAERLENSRNVFRAPLTRSDLELMNFKDFCERVEHKWEKEKRDPADDDDDLPKRRVKVRDKRTGNWIFRFGPRRKHVRWSTEIYSPLAYKTDSLDDDDITLEQILYTDLDPEKRVLYNKAYQELVCYVPWSVSPDETFLSQIERESLKENDPEAQKRYSRMRLEMFYQRYRELEAGRGPNNKFAPIDSDWRRDQVYSNTMYMALNHNRDVYDERKRNNGVFKPEFQQAEELAGINVPIRPDIDGCVEDNENDEYPVTNSFLPCDIFQDILKQPAPKLDEITICHPSQKIWQSTKSRCVPKRASRERNWFMANPPQPRHSFSELTDMQKQAYNYITDKDRDRILYVVGKAGTGKTELALHVCQYFKGKVQAGAGTAKASMIFRGPNLHAMFGWNKNEFTETFETREGEIKLAELQEMYKDVVCFVIDEVNAISASALGTLDLTLRKIYRSTSPFGGRVMLFLGDPSQLRPVSSAAIYDASVPRTNDNSRYNRRRAPINSLYRKRSNAGQELYPKLENRCIVLKQGKRNTGLLQVIMDHVRDGSQTIDDLRKLRHQAMKYPDLQVDYGMHYNNDSCLINNLKAVWSAASKISQRVHVCPASYNEKVTADSASLSYLRSIRSQHYGYANDILCLSEGAEVRLLENLNTEAGLVNSITGVLQKVLYDSKDVDALLEGKFPAPYCLLVRFESFRGFLVDKKSKERYFPFPQDKKLVPIFSKNFSCEDDLPRQVRLKHDRSACYRHQFPIDLARHLTCHRAQGQSLENHNVGIDLDLASSLSKMPDNIGSIFYVAGTRTSHVQNVFLQAIHPDIWLKIGQTEGDKARRLVQKRLEQKAEEFARKKGFYNVFFKESRIAKEQIPTAAELNLEWRELQNKQSPPPSIGLPILQQVDCPLSKLPGCLNPVDGERHIGIDQGIRAFAICVVDKFRGKDPILQTADLHDLSSFLPSNFKGTDLLKALHDQTKLLKYMDVVNNRPADPAVKAIDRVVVHLEQVSIENPHFEAYTRELGDLLQARASDYSKLIVKLSSSNVHREDGPTSKLGDKIRQDCQLGSSRSDKGMSQRLFEYLMNASPSDQSDMKICINPGLQNYWRNKINASSTKLRLHDLGDAFLHAIDEVLCKMTNYRQLVPCDPVLSNNRSILLYFLSAKVYYVIVTCYHNKFILEKMDWYSPEYERELMYKGMDTNLVTDFMPSALKVAMSDHGGNNIYPPVDTIKIILRQTSHYKKQIAARLGCLVNTAVQAMEIFVSKIDSSSKETKSTKPVYRYTRSLRNGKKFEIVRSRGKHTNNIITFLECMEEIDPTYSQTRQLRLAPISQKEFFLKLRDISQKNLASPTITCKLGMFFISPNAQSSILTVNNHDEQIRFGDLILDNLNQNQKHLKALANEHNRNKNKALGSQVPGSIPRANSGSKRKPSPSPPSRQSASTSSSTSQPMDVDDPNVCICSLPNRVCRAKKHMRLQCNVRK